MIVNFRWLEIVRQKDAEIARLRKALSESKSNEGVSMRIIDAIKTTDDTNGEPLTMLAIEIVDDPDEKLDGGEGEEG